MVLLVRYSQLPPLGIWMLVAGSSLPTNEPMTMLTSEMKMLAKNAVQKPDNVKPRTTHANRSILLFVLVTLQASIGIATLLSAVDFHTALTHQGMAIVLLFFAVAHWRGTKGSYPLPTEVSVRH